MLADYAEKRLTHATGVGRDKILGTIPPTLREAGGIYEKYTVELAKAADFLLRKHGKSIADAPTRAEARRRHRDRFVRGPVRVVARRRACRRRAGRRAVRRSAIAQVFAQQAKRRMANNIRRVTRNEDEAMHKLAGFVLGEASYVWDIL